MVIAEFFVQNDGKIKNLAKSVESGPGENLYQVNRLTASNLGLCNMHKDLLPDQVEGVFRT